MEITAMLVHLLFFIPPHFSSFVFTANGTVQKSKCVRFLHRLELYHMSAAITIKIIGLLKRKHAAK